MANFENIIVTSESKEIIDELEKKNKDEVFEIIRVEPELWIRNRHGRTRPLLIELSNQFKGKSIIAKFTFDIERHNKTYTLKIESGEIRNMDIKENNYFIEETITEETQQPDYIEEVYSRYNGCYDIPF